MQKVAQESLILHQMDVKTAYLHAPIDCELYIELPEGYQTRSETGEKLVYKLHEYLYGLKWSGRTDIGLILIIAVRNESVLAHGETLLG